MCFAALVFVGVVRLFSVGFRAHAQHVVSLHVRHVLVNKQSANVCHPPAVEMDKNRNTKFNASVLNEVDSNNDPISRWCKSGTRNTDAFCILCNCTISCAQHGAAAVKRHAGMKKQIDAAARHRDKDGNLLPPKLVQGTLDFSNGSANTSLEHQVSKAETTFALSVVAKGIPFSWGDTATSIYHCMFPDSDIAKSLVAAE
nr:uncharacterized protein LOC119169904 [Rhipicephalus microplus]